MRVSELPVGAKLKDAQGGHSFLIGEHDHPGWEDLTVLVAERVIALRALDEPKDTYADAESKRFGSNNYPATDLHAWLNDDSDAGFIPELSDSLRTALVPVSVPYSPAPEEIINFEAKVFLPSLEELWIPCPDHTIEGSHIALFKEFRRRYALPTEEVVAERHNDFGVLNTDDSWCYWLRSSHPLHASAQYISHSHSAYTFFTANRDYVGVRPMLCVRSDLPIGRINGVYTVIPGERSL